MSTTTISTRKLARSLRTTSSVLHDIAMALGMPPTSRGRERQWTREEALAARAYLQRARPPVRFMEKPYVDIQLTEAQDLAALYALAIERVTGVSLARMLTPLRDTPTSCARGALIFFLANSGFSQATIARVLCCHQSTVHYYARMFQRLEKHPAGPVMARNAERIAHITRRAQVFLPLIAVPILESDAYHHLQEQLTAPLGMRQAGAFLDACLGAGPQVDTATYVRGLQVLARYPRLRLQLLSLLDSPARERLDYTLSSAIASLGYKAAVA